MNHYTNIFTEFILFLVIGAAILLTSILAGIGELGLIILAVCAGMFCFLRLLYTQKAILEELKTLNEQLKK